MKMLRLYGAIIVVVLCVTAGLVFAQGIPIPPPPTVPLVACADAAVTSPCDTLATQPEDILGVWSVYFNAEPAFIRYNLDGTWVIGDTVESTTASSVEGYPSGTYSFDEDGLFTSFDPNTPVEVMPGECRGGHYQLRVITVGGQPVALNHAVRDDCFAPRRTDWAYTMLWAGSGE